MKLSCFFIMLFFIPSSLLAQWDINDVSYLMPLPKSLESSSLIQMSSSGLGGSLSQSIHLREMPSLTMHLTEKQTLTALRVMAVRIDPCFVLPPPRACQKQIRLVWQPLEMDRFNQLQTVDAALHTFYVLSDEEFSNLLFDLKNWKKSAQAETAGKALDIHPAWSDTGEKSPHLKSFNQIILKYIGPKNFFRVTQMTLRGGGDMWTFSSFEPKNGRLIETPIARLGNETTQAFVNLSVPSDHFDGMGMTPQPQGEDTMSTIAGEVTDRPVPEDVILQEIRALYKTENPRNFHAENMDCVSCHVAQPVKYFFDRKNPQLKLKEVWKEFQYQNANYNLENRTENPNNTQAIRAFGYFGRQKVISQRVINESAAVANELNQKPE